MIYSLITGAAAVAGAFVGGGAGGIRTTTPTVTQQPTVAPIITPHIAPTICPQTTQEPRAQQDLHTTTNTHIAPNTQVNANPNIIITINGQTTPVPENRTSFASWFSASATQQTTQRAATATRQVQVPHIQNNTQPTMAPAAPQPEVVEVGSALPRQILLSSVFAGTGSLFYWLRTTEQIIHNSSGWCNWNKGALPVKTPEQLAQPLMEEIQQRYTTAANAYDVLQPIQLFCRDVDAERASLNRYITISSVLQSIFINRLFGVTAQNIVLARERVKHLTLLKKTLAHWMIEHHMPLRT